MNPELEKTEQAVLNAACRLPKLPSKLKRQVLVDAERARVGVRRRRSAAVVAGLLLLIAAGSVSLRVGAASCTDIAKTHAEVQPPVPVHVSAQESDDSGDEVVESFIDRLNSRSTVFRAGW